MIAEALLCMTLNLYHEARDQSERGVKAVAAVTMNRAKKTKNVCSVVTKPKQFSWTSNKLVFTHKQRKLLAKQIKEHDPKSWKRVSRIALLAVSEKLSSPVHNALYFYNPKLAQPKWARKRLVIARIDDHVFLR